MEDGERIGRRWIRGSTRYSSWSQSSPNRALARPAWGAWPVPCSRLQLLGLVKGYEPASGMLLTAAPGQACFQEAKL